MTVCRTFIGRRSSDSLQDGIEQGGRHETLRVSSYSYRHPRGRGPCGVGTLPGDVSIMGQ